MKALTILANFCRITRNFNIHYFTFTLVSNKAKELEKLGIAEFRVFEHKIQHYSSVDILKESVIPSRNPGKIIIQKR